MTAPSSSFPHIGDTFQDRYVLEEVVGQGGYARVYRARQTDLGRDVAIKILRSQYRNAQKAEEAALRFEREAKLVSQLNDPHTITVFDYGRTESGGLYMITEYIKGTNLLDYVNERGAVPPHVASTMILGVLFSLQEAHERGILHRDIKPANVMIFDLRGRPNQVKLLDFGIAKAFEDDSVGSNSMAVALTGQGRVVGSPGYMSPEQIRGEQLTPASDIYSVGLIFYEALAAQRAIQANDLQAAFRQIDEKPILLPDELELPDGLREVVHKMIEKNPLERFSKVDDVIKALAPFGVSDPTGQQEIREAPNEPSSGEPNDQATRYLLLAIAALVVAAIAVGAFLYTNL